MAEHMPGDPGADGRFVRLDDGDMVRRGRTIDAWSMATTLKQPLERHQLAWAVAGTEPQMASEDERAGGQVGPVLVGRQVQVRPGRPGDAPQLHAILAEPSVSRWFGDPDPVTVIEDDLRGSGSSVLLVVEVGGQVAGGIQYHEEPDPMYRHAGIDIYLGSHFQGRGAGREAVALLARYLFEQRGHHRITIDPAVANAQAIRSYTKVGFRPVGVMRQYERGGDGRFHDGLLMDLLRGELASGW